jgi:hypothetical protein
LDGVSEALLGVEKNPFAAEEFAPPPGLAESSRGAMNLAETPTGLIVGPAVFPIAQAELGQSQVIECAGMGGVTLDGLLVRMEGFGHSAYV